MIPRAENRLWAWAEWRSNIIGVWPSESLTYRTWKEGPIGASIKGIQGEKLPFHKIDPYSHRIEYIYDQMEYLWKKIIETRYLETIRNPCKASKECGVSKSKYFRELHNIHQYLINSWE